MSEKVNIAVVDDHKLFRSGLINLIHSLDLEVIVSIEANNGKELVEFLNRGASPDIVLLDANMPILNGYDTASILQKNYPNIKVLVITMNNDEQSVIKMLKLGVRGYIGKDVEPEELKQALIHIIEKGYYYTDQLTGQLIQALHIPSKPLSDKGNLSEQELTFIRLACSEDTYSQIADKMFLSPKTIDGYRASVFEKLNIKSRVGLVLYAIKAGLVSTDE